MIYSLIINSELYIYLLYLFSVYTSVRISMDFEMDDRGISVRFPTKAGNNSLLYSVQIGPGTHPASYTMDTVGSFPRGKAGVVEPTTHLHLMPRVKTRGAIPPVPHTSS
jgi:hypothetical protein